MSDVRNKLICVCGSVVPHEIGYGVCPKCYRKWAYEPNKRMWANVTKEPVIENKDTDTHADFQSGAKSSGHKPHYHLVPFEIFLERLAARYSFGASKYGEGNWAKGLGDRQYVMDRANHTLEHLLAAISDLRRGVKSDDDDLAAVIWGAIFLMGAQAELGKGDGNGTTTGK